MVHYLPHAEYHTSAYNTSLTLTFKPCFFFLSAYLVLHMLLLCIRLPLCREKESKKVFIRVCVIVREEDRKRENFGVNQTAEG